MREKLSRHLQAIEIEHESIGTSIVVDAQAVSLRQ
jgi:hypothetical protein